MVYFVIFILSETRRDHMSLPINEGKKLSTNLINTKCSNNIMDNSANIVIILAVELFISKLKSTWETKDLPIT